MPDPTPADETARLIALDKRHVWHPFTHGRLWADDRPGEVVVIAAADGMELIDTRGRRYLDGVSSLWCNVHGHRVPAIDAAIRAQLDAVAHTTLLGLASRPSIELAARLAAIAPPGLPRVFYSDAGATATEVAFKLAVQYWANIGQPARREFVALGGAYHGDTFGAMAVGRSEAFHAAYMPMLFPVHYVPPPHRMPMAQCLLQLEQTLANRAAHVAAVCIEPVVQGAAGVIVQPPGFVAAVRAACDRHGVLMIADEVATGFGRTGQLFACNHDAVSPDLLCVAKGLTGGYLPLAATLTTDAIHDAFLGEPWEGRTFFHGHTYTGNPLACAAAMASLDLLLAPGFMERVRDNAGWLADRLAPLARLPHVAEIRQRGLMVGVELTESPGQPFDPRRRVGAAVCQAIRRHGVMLRPLGDVIILMPPLAMGTTDLGRIVDALHAEVTALS